MSLIDCHPCRSPHPWSDSRFFAAAPTRDQAKRIYWNDFKKLVPENWVRRIYETDLCIITRWGAELWVQGLDKPERIEGVPWDGGGIDELANCKPGIWDAHIRPALADREGWCWQIGVPDANSPGQIEYKRRYDMIRDGRLNNWDTFHWPSSDILSDTEITDLKATMDSQMFRQEMGGEFIIASGLAFPTFDYKTHVNDEIAQYDPALGLCWCLDFNINPFCSGIIQHIPNTSEIRVIHELVLRNTDTNSMCEAFADLAREKKWNTQDMQIYGDPAGHARQTQTGNSDWAIIEQRMANYNAYLNVPRSHAPIKDTLNAVRAKLQTGDGKTHVFFNSQCKQLIEDMQTLLWPSKLDEGHCAAWLRYFIQEEYSLDNAGQVDIGVYEW